MTAPTKTLPLTSEVADVLQRSTISLSSRLLKLPQQLDRKLYVDVNKILVALGGKWDRRAGGHVFEDERFGDRLAEALLAEGLVVEKLGWFPTPPPLVDRLLELAEIEPQHIVLEPSAGRGAIALRLKELVADANLYCVEIDAGRCDALREAGVFCMFGDFLQIPWIPELQGGFDRVVMNPPFERDQAWAHIAHAYSLLKPGGRLVSIAPNNVPPGSEGLRVLRERLPMADTIWKEQNSEGAFKMSGTAVRTITVMLDRDPA
jgi:SAM-dependent methyltransferase